MPKESVLQTAANAFGLQSHLLTPIGGNVNEVYKHPAQGDYPARVLRLSNESWRSQQEALAELHFMNDLFDKGVAVPRIFPSTTGKWIESVTDGYHASVFAEAPGRIPLEEDWGPTMIGNWGRLVGQMHLHTKSYEPLPDARRRDWTQEPWMDMMRHLPEEEVIARQQARSLLSWLETLPRDRNDYGLVHCDLHAKNMFVTDDGAVTAFDFDDSCYHWFAYDIAIILYSVILRYKRQATTSETLDVHAARFLDRFLHGYQEVHTPASWWLGALPNFLSYKQLLDYNFLHHRYDWQTANGELKKNWLRLKAEIEAGEPLVRLDASNG